MSDKDEMERQRFERWVGHAYGEDRIIRCGIFENEYENWLIQDLWQAWQAALSRKQEEE